MSTALDRQSCDLGAPLDSLQQWNRTALRQEVVPIYEAMLPIVVQYGVFATAALILLGQLGVPLGVPAEIALLLVGSFAIHTVPALVMGVLIIAAADVVGSIVLYALVRGGSTRYRRRRGSQAASPRWRFLERHRVATTLVIRSLPFVRIYAAIGCGLTRVRLRDYLAGAVPAAFFWVGTPLSIGFLLRGDVQDVINRYPSGTALVCAIPAAAGAIVLTRCLVRRRAAPAPRVS